MTQELSRMHALMMLRMGTMHAESKAAAAAAFDE